MQTAEKPKLEVLVIAPDGPDLEHVKQCIVASRVPCNTHVGALPEAVDPDVIVVRIAPSTSATEAIKATRLDFPSASIVAWAREKERAESKELLVNSYVVRSESLAELIAGMRDILELVRS